jgi:hypothetical protein
MSELASELCLNIQQIPSEFAFPVLPTAVPKPYINQSSIQLGRLSANLDANVRVRCLGRVSGRCPAGRTDGPFIQWWRGFAGDRCLDQGSSQNRARKALEPIFYASAPPGTRIGQNTRNPLIQWTFPTSSRFIPPLPGCSGSWVRSQKGGGVGSGYGIGLRRGRAKRVLASPNLSWYLSPPPVGLGRGAQAKADQGSRLSEPKASSSETPLLPSTAGCPQRSEGTQTIGSPSLCLLSLGDARESESPAGARPGLSEAPPTFKLAQASTLRQALDRPSSARTVVVFEHGSRIKSGMTTRGRRRVFTPKPSA